MYEKNEAILIRIPFTGFPYPKAKWFKGMDEVKPSGTYKIETGNHFVVLKINNPQRIHSGIYKLVLENNRIR